MNKDRPLASGEPKERGANRDPVGGAPSAHPVGTGAADTWRRLGHATNREAPGDSDRYLA
jgi:hypothetical protein